MYFNPLLVGSKRVVIVVELDREDHGSIPETAIERGLESFDARTGGEKKSTSSTWHETRKKNFRSDML
jgi:hypothetical protein